MQHLNVNSNKRSTFVKEMQILSDILLQYIYITITSLIDCIAGCWFLQIYLPIYPSLQKKGGKMVYVSGREAKGRWFDSRRRHIFIFNWKYFLIEFFAY